MPEFISVAEVNGVENGVYAYTSDGIEYYCHGRIAATLKPGQTYLVEVVRREAEWDCHEIIDVYATPQGVSEPKEKRMTEVIEVGAIGPYGVKVGSEWYKYGKGIDPAKFTKGGRYNVVTNPGPKGGKYINKLMESVTGAPTPVALDPAINANTPPVNTNEDLKAMAAKAGVPMKNGKPLSAYEVDQDQRIRRSGVIQAAAQCSVLNQVVTDGSKETLKAAVRELAEDMLAWVNEKAGGSNEARS